MFGDDGDVGVAFAGEMQGGCETAYTGSDTCNVNTSIYMMNETLDVPEAYPRTTMFAMVMLQRDTGLEESKDQMGACEPVAT